MRYPPSIFVQEFMDFAAFSATADGSWKPSSYCQSMVDQFYGDDDEGTDESGDEDSEEADNYE